jgi:hypothetical protein
MKLKEEDRPNYRGSVMPDAAVKRRCLMCKDMFERAWSGERVCKRCRGSGTWKNSLAHRSI